MSLLSKLFLLVLRVYKKIVSPHLPAACRFYPSCSDYAAQSIEKHGALKGSARALHRISRCHPFHAGGVDLVD